MSSASVIMWFKVVLYVEASRESTFCSQGISIIVTCAELSVYTCKSNHGHYSFSKKLSRGIPCCVNHP